MLKEFKSFSIIPNQAVVAGYPNQAIGGGGNIHGLPGVKTLRKPEVVKDNFISLGFCYYTSSKK